jgi:protein TonB
MVPPPPAIPVTPEPPLVSAAPDEAPPPPPAKPVLRQSRPRPATAPVMPPAAAATTPADTQLAAAATLMPAPPSAPPSEAAYLPPRPMSAGDPGYPAEARQRGWQGRVVLRLEVSAEGAVSSVSVKSSSGHGILDNAALAKARTWRFIPAKRGGDAVTASVDWPIVFRLED